MGVFISRVEEGSVADRAGLRPGDTILEVNGTPFRAVTHEEALKVSFRLSVYRYTRPLPHSLPPKSQIVVVVDVPVQFPVPAHHLPCPLPATGRSPTSLVIERKEEGGEGAPKMEPDQLRESRVSSRVIART